MQISWFTLVAQIFNFLVLVLLLRRFLFPVVISAMDRREKQIASRFEEAENKIKEAQKAESEYDRLKQELGAKKDELINQYKGEAEKIRQDMLTKSRGEVEEQKTKWLKDLENQSDDFLRDLRKKVSQQVLSVTRRVLTDLSGKELNSYMVVSFIEHLRRSNDNDLALLRNNLDKSHSEVTINTASELDDAGKQNVGKVLGEILPGNLNIKFSVTPDLISGIEILAGDARVTWNIDQYLSDLEEEVSKTLRAVA